MNRNNNLITFIFSSVLFIFFILQSKVSFDMLLSPMSAVFGTFEGAGLGVNWLFLSLAIMFFCISFALFIMYAHDNPGDSFILIGSAMISVIIIVVHSFSIPAIIFSIGLFTAYFYMFSSVKSGKKKVKSQTIFNTSLSVSSMALTIVNLSIALAVLLVLVNNPSYADDEMSSMSSSMFGMDISDIDSFQQQILEQQKVAAYAQIEAIETSVLYGIYDETSGLTASEKQKCFTAINSSMEKIDRNAKASIDFQLAMASSDPKFSTIESTLNLLNKFKIYYPYITFLTVFMILGMIKLFMRYVIALVARILWVPPVVPSSRHSSQQVLSSSQQVPESQQVPSLSQQVPESQRISM